MSCCAVILPPVLLGPAGRYALMAAAGSVVVNTALPFDKRRKQAHRFTIADTRGPLTLTVPVAKPAVHHTATWVDIIVSDHGNWPPALIESLASAYGRTPYFEFYIDRLAPIFHDAPCRPLMELSAQLDAEIMRMLQLPGSVSYAPAEGLSALESYPSVGEYWQVRADKLGFLPGLSVLDILFNLGPEASLIIKPL